MRREYRDKNNKIVQDEDFVLVEDELVCQALRCEDGTLLYEELKWDFNKEKVVLTDDPNYPDAYDNNEIEIISYNKVVKLLREENVK